MITEDYCSYEVSKLLKEKGFPFCAVIGSAWVKEDNKITMHSEQVPITWCDENQVLATTQALAMKWLREKKDLLIDISFVRYMDEPRVLWSFAIFTIYDYSELKTDDKEYPTYEEAVEAALKYSLENLIHDEEENQTSKDDQC